nr:MAG TPA: hypothetical protein [Caudoviricetes sp.]
MRHAATVRIFLLSCLGNPCHYQRLVFRINTLSLQCDVAPHGGGVCHRRSGA